MDKIGEFIEDVTKRHVLGKLAGWCYSVEHQKRGTVILLALFLFILFFYRRYAAHPHVDDHGQARARYYACAGGSIHLCTCSAIAAYGRL